MRRRLLTWLFPLCTATAITACATATPSHRPDVPVLRQTLQDILSSGYQLSEPPQARLHEIVTRALRALRGLLGDLSDAEPLSGLPMWARPVLTGVLIVLLVLMIAHIVSSLRGLLGGSDGSHERRGPEVERADPQTVLRQAEAAFGRGEHDAALRLLYLAVLLRLDRLGLLTHDPARTNWENLRALTTAQAEARDAMARLTRDVDACLYGGRGTSHETWEQAREWAELLWRAERPV